MMTNYGYSPLRQTKKSIHRYDGVCFGTTREYIMNKHHNDRVKIKKKTPGGSMTIQLEK